MVLDSVRHDLDPRFVLGSLDGKLSRLVAPGLTTVDTPDLEPQLMLAESIERVGDLRWRVRLKPGLRFPDGSPVKASDVAFTYNSVIDPKVGSTSRQAFAERFASVTVVSELEVDFVLHESIATFLSDLDFGIISESAASESPTRLLGAGAFFVDSFRPEDVFLRRNPHYAALGELAQIERIEIKTVRDENARNLMLVGGSADFSQNETRPDLVEFITKRERIEVQSGPSSILTYLMFKNDDPKLADRRVRRAIALAIDRKRIIEAKFGGHAVLATGLLPPFHWAYNGDVERYEPNLPEAKRLLDEAGYPDPDGPGGEPRMRLSFKTSSNQFRLAVARVLASQLREIGIEIEVHSFEWGTFLADIKTGNYQLASMQTSAITEPDYYFAYFHSSRIPTDDSPNLLNRWRYRDARIDELTDTARHTMDRDTRAALYHQVQSILAQDLPIIPLWHEDNIAIMNKSVRGYSLLPSARLAGFVTVSKQP